MLRIIHFVQNLSLDITIGAMISSWFIGELLEVPVSGPMIAGLGIAIWLIYTADHLLDAQKAEGQIANPRHDFHRRYQKPILALALLFFGLGIFNAFQLPERTIYYGLVLVGLSGLYFLYLKLSPSQRFKELFAALVYTAGLFTGPLSLLSELGWPVLVLSLQFFLLAFANLLILPMYEQEIDQQQGVASVATRKGSKVVQFEARIAIALSYGLIMLVVFLSDRFDQESAVFTLMTTALLALVSKPSLFRQYQLYRLIGDGVFFLPALAWFL